MLKPSSDGVPGNPLDPSNRGHAATLDPERHHRVEPSSSMLETVVRRALGRGEHLSARDAPVSTAFPGSRSVETVADDVPGTDASMDRTYGIGTFAILQFGLALVDENCVSRNRAQTLARRRVTDSSPTLGCGSSPRRCLFRPLTAATRLFLCLGNHFRGAGRQVRVKVLGYSAVS